MSLNESLMVVIRVLTIILLCVAIYAAVQGALLVRDIRQTANERMDRGEFPIPLGGITDGLAEKLNRSKES
jgi:hypothetical protein